MSITTSAGMINETIDGLKINSSLLINSKNYTTNSSRTIKYVVVHYTGNTKDTAVNNVKYYQTGGRSASAHFFVDESNIYQGVKLKDSAWHCGTSKTYYHNDCRNANSIGIEMCCSGNYIVSETTKKHSAYLCAYLLKLLNVSAKEVDTYLLRHYDVTHKLCPKQMAGDNNSEWINFKKQVKNILNEEGDEDMTQETFNSMFLALRKTLQDNDCSNYSAEAREWATSSGLVQGNGTASDGQPNCMWQDLLTREQLVTILYRYAKMIGKV